MNIVLTELYPLNRGKRTRRTQYDQIGALIKRKQGATPFELMTVSGSTCIHKRMSEMKQMGWTITRTPIDGKTYGIYRGKAPK